MPRRRHSLPVFFADAVNEGCYFACTPQEASNATCNVSPLPVPLTALYEAEEDLRAFYKQLDPTNTFNPRIGKMDKYRRNCSCCG